MTGGEKAGLFDWRQTRVAGLVAVAAILLAYGVYRVGLMFDVFESRYELAVVVPTASGLRAGAPVTLAGQRVGQVKSIEFIPVHRKTDGNNLLVIIAVADNVQDQIRDDSRLFLRTQGLLGDRFVDIAPGTAGARILQPGDTIAAGQSLDMDQFLEMAAGTLDQAAVVVANLQDVTGGLSRGEGTMGHMLRDEQLYHNMTAATIEMRAMLAQINNADGTFGRLLRDPELYERMQGAIARVDSLGEQLLHGDGSIAQLLRSDSLYRSMLNTMLSADTAAADLSEFVQRMTTSDGALQKLLTDPQLYDEFLRAVIEVQSLIRDIRLNPSKYKPNITVDVF